MRIAVVYDRLFPWSTGDAERLYRIFAEEFAAAGHEVTYLTRQQWADDDPPSLPGVTVTVVGRHRAADCANGCADHPADRAAAQPADHAADRADGSAGHPADHPADRADRRADPAPDPGTGSADRRADRRPGRPVLSFARGLFAHLSRHRTSYDAVLVSATPAGNVLAARAALAGSRVLVAADWLEVWRAEQWRERYGPVAGRAAAVVQGLAIRLSPMATCHTGLTAARLRERGLLGEPVRSPGLIDGIGTAAPTLTPHEPPRLVFIGPHIPDNHVEELPAAVAHARREIPNLTATIFGDGPTRDVVRAEIHRLSLGGVVRLPGSAGPDELDHALRTAACLVHPSTREGYGLLVVESCAAATPVVLVAAQDNAAVELIEDGVNGIVAPSLAPADLGAAIVEVVTQGEPLRKTTYGWFVQASRTRTVRATARRIAAHLAERVALSTLPA